MTSQTRHRSKKVAVPSDDESRAAAREIAEAAAQVAQARKDGNELGKLPDSAESAESIPMLTDYIEPGESATAGATAADSAVAFDVGPVSEEDWNEIALLVQKNVMKSMIRRTDELVHGELRAQLDALLDRGAERLMVDIKNTMQQTISDAVSEAIAQELNQARQRVRQQPELNKKRHNDG